MRLFLFYSLVIFSLLSDLRADDQGHPQSYSDVITENAFARMQPSEILRLASDDSIDSIVRGRALIEYLDRLTADDNLNEVVEKLKTYQLDSKIRFFLVQQPYGHRSYLNIKPDIILERRVMGFSVFEGDFKSMCMFGAFLFKAALPHGITATKSSRDSLSIDGDIRFPQLENVVIDDEANIARRLFQHELISKEALHSVLFPGVKELSNRPMLNELLEGIDARGLSKAELEDRIKLKHDNIPSGDAE